MKLLILRHAIALPRGTPGIPDGDRPLTREGIRKFRRAAAGLARIARPPDVLFTSTLRRAQATAAIAARAWGRPRPRELPALARGEVEEVLKALARLPQDSLVAVVGHEPQLSALLARLVGGTHAERLTFRKGGAALVEMPGRPSTGGALLWYLPPRILRRLGSR